MESYEWDSEGYNSSIFSQDSWFVKPGAAMSDSRDVSWINDLTYYTIQNWDTLSSISDKFNVSVNSILWSNEFWSNRVLKPWDTIRIPPVTWIVYNVSPNDTLDSISDKFKVDKVNILAQNQLDASQELKIWQRLVLPGAKKPEAPKPIIIEKKPEITTASDKRVAKASDSNKDKKIKSTKSLSKTYSVAYTWNWRWFAYGNCTYFVANHKKVTWRWNANQWLSNAKAAWVATWSSPANWAIISFRGSWYNPYYWHVWIVSEVWDDYIIVKDMNYRRFNEVTVRKIPKNDSSIKGYIYSD